MHIFVGKIKCKHFFSVHGSTVRNIQEHIHCFNIPVHHKQIWLSYNSMPNSCFIV